MNSANSPPLLTGLTGSRQEAISRLAQIPVLQGPDPIWEPFADTLTPHNLRVPVPRLRSRNSLQPRPPIGDNTPGLAWFRSFTVAARVAARFRRHRSCRAFVLPDALVYPAIDAADEACATGVYLAGREDAAA